jgi:geranyl-CoA carboxylase alpha subunit
VTTNRAFLHRILQDRTFAAGQATTALLDDADLTCDPQPSSHEFAAAAALMHRQREDVAQRRSPGLAGWTSAGAQRLAAANRVIDVDLTRTVDALEVKIDSTTHVVEILGACEESMIRVDGRTMVVDACAVDWDRLAIRFPPLSSARRQHRVPISDRHDVAETFTTQKRREHQRSQFQSSKGAQIFGHY